MSGAFNAARYGAPSSSDHTRRLAAKRSRRGGRSHRSRSARAADTGIGAGAPVAEVPLAAAGATGPTGPGGAEPAGRAPPVAASAQAPTALAGRPGRLHHRAQRRLATAVPQDHRWHHRPTGQTLQARGAVGAVRASVQAWEAGGSRRLRRQGHVRRELLRQGRVSRWRRCAGRWTSCAGLGGLSPRRCTPA